MSNNDTDNPYYSNSVIKHYNQNDQEGIIDINGNIFNIFVQQHIDSITLDQIKYFYNALYVIEIVLQEKTGLINQDQINDIFSIYPELRYLYNIFNEGTEKELILMMWLLTFIINTGWFYVDLDPYDPNLTLDQNVELGNNLYSDLQIIQNILFTNMDNLISDFLPNQLNIRGLNDIWLQIIQNIKNRKVLSDIIESHISNLFTFIHDNNNFQTVDNIIYFINLCIDEIIPQPQTGLQLQRPPEEQYMSVKQLRPGNFGKRPQGTNVIKRIKESKAKRTEGINTRRIPQKSQQNNNNTSGMGREKISQPNNNNTYKNTSGMGREMRKQLRSQMGIGGNYTKKKRYLKAIKRNNKKYSIKKKHKKTKKRKYTKKGNIQKIVKTYKLY
jgi:hypothetical protein